MRKKLPIILGSCALIFSSIATLASCQGETTQEVEIPHYNVNLENVLTVGQNNKIVVSGTKEGDVVEFVSSDSSVVTVDATGLVAAIKKGETTITVKINQKLINEIPVKVVEPVKNPLEDMLRGVAKGFKARNIYVEEQDFGIDSEGNHDVNYQTRYTETDRNGEFNYVKRYKTTSVKEPTVPDVTPDADPGKVYSSYIFAKNPDEKSDNAATVYLSMANKIEYSPAKNGVGVIHKWYSSFGNYFALLNAENFTKSKTNPNDYELDCTNKALQTVYDSIADNIYGDFIETSVDKFIIHTDGTKITGYEGSFKPISSTQWTLTSTVRFKGIITEIGEQSFESPKPYAGTADKAFDDKMAELKLGNYKVATKQISRYNGQDTFDFIDGASDGGTNVIRNNYKKNMNTTEGLVSENLYYTFKSYNSFYTQKATKINGVYYKSMSRVMASIKDKMLPKFTISSELFTKENNTYKFVGKDKLPFYFVTGKTSDFSVFKNNIFDSLDVTIANDKVDFKAVSAGFFGDTIEETSYTSIGTVKDLVAKDLKVENNTDKFTNIKEYFYSEKDYTDAVGLVGTELLDMIPLPGGTVSEMLATTNIKRQQVQIKFQLDANGDAKGQFTDLVVEGASIAAAKGFVFNPENWSGYEFNKQHEVNGVMKNVEVSYGIFSDFFVADIIISDIAPKA